VMAFGNTVMNLRVCVSRRDGRLSALSDNFTLSVGWFQFVLREIKKQVTAKQYLSRRFT
jgi:hypothetical protein